MSLRIYPFAASALLLASLCGAASPVIAADTKPLVPETCVAVKRTTVPSGHPGKSIQLPKRAKDDAAQCSRPARKRLVLATYEDFTGGRALMAGRSERAIEKINAAWSKRPSAEALTNLCVAHTVLRQWPEARDNCDAAVATATASRAKLMYRPGVSRTQLDTAASLAYSNRAVMHWLSHDTLAAQDDLASARSISPRAYYVMRNARLDLEMPSLAQAMSEAVEIG